MNVILSEIPGPAVLNGASGQRGVGSDPDSGQHPQRRDTTANEIGL